MSSYRPKASEAEAALTALRNARLIVRNLQNDDEKQEGIETELIEVHNYIDIAMTALGEDR